MLEVLNLPSNFSFILPTSLSLDISLPVPRMDGEITDSMPDRSVLWILPVALLPLAVVSKQHFLVTTPRSRSITSGQIIQIIHRRNVKWQSEKTTRSMIPTIQHSGKGKTMGIGRRSVAARGGPREVRNEYAEQRIFRAMGLFYTLLQW